MLVVLCDMVWILTDFDVSAAILVDVRCFGNVAD